jgi:pimeloyl-ACP methyl ester carboxylesterase
MILSTNTNGQSLGVHLLLQYDFSTGISNAAKQAKYSALYMNHHGFGASLLSWLPVISELTKRLRVKKMLAHDAVGCGFTDQSKDVDLYTPNISSEIGLQILNNKEVDAAGSLILLMRHSMGSYGTLEMVSKLPEDILVKVVLVAPALVALLQCTEDDSSPLSLMADFLQSYVVGPPMHYLLR